MEPRWDVMFMQYNKLAHPASAERWSFGLFAEEAQMLKIAGILAVTTFLACPSWDRDLQPRAAELQATAPPVISSYPLDLASRFFPQRYPHPASQWQSAEKARYQKLLASGHFDVIVVPFQVRNYAFDRSINSLMTAELSLAVADTENLRVPDPYLVARALGEGTRKLDPLDVYRLAAATGATKIIWSHVGHDGNLSLALSIEVQEKPSDQPLGPTIKATSHNFENIPFSDAKSPVDVYEAVLPRVMDALGMGNLPIAASGSARPDALSLPSAPFKMTSGAADPLRDAYYFQVLAALAPVVAQRARGRFAEKSLLALRRISRDDPEYRYLKARSLMQMGMRPAALNALGKPASDEEKALYALLNGNLPEVLAATARIKSPVKRFIAEFDAVLIRSSYGVYKSANAASKIDSMKLPGKDWRTLALRAYTDVDDWNQFDNLQLKQLIDADYPLEGFTAEGIARGAATIGDPAKAQASADFSVRNHVLRLIDKDPGNWCCKLDIARPTRQDFLDLIEELATDNLSRRVNFLISLQGQPERGLEQLNLLEPVYKDHPRFTLLRARAEAATATRKEGPVKEGLLKSAYVNALNAYYWEQGQSFDSADAFQLLISLQRSDYGDLKNVYLRDYPLPPYSSTWSDGGDIDASLRYEAVALNNATYDTRPIFRLNSILGEIRKDDTKLAALFESVRDRFSGNAAIAGLKGNNALRRGDIHAAESSFREALSVQPSQWQPYQDLTELLYRDGRIEQAAKVATSYPGFTPDSTENKVGIANNAYYAGSLFYWSGNFSEAVPLYEVAAGLNTGADSSISSELRLKLLQGDYLAAVEGSYLRATRYNSSYAYRDYLGLLHTMGYSKEAWDAFNLLVTQLDGPPIWETALVGHRRERASEAAIIAWARQDVFRGLGRTSNDAAKYLLRTAVTDRSPSEATISAIAELDAPVWKVSFIRDQTVRVSRNGEIQFVLGPESTEGSTLPVQAFDRSKKVRIKSDLVYFAEAYKAMREKKYEDARALLDDAAAQFDLSQPSLGYILPYAAFAAAKTGKTELVEKKLSTYNAGILDFDKLLAQAVLSGIAGRTEESVQLLKRAVYRRPYTEARPVYTEYEFAEIAEWLYEATGKAKYRDLALDWARKVQKTQPWHAWAYALEAKLATDAGARRKAIGMANYLDPDSDRLRSVSKKELGAAVKDFRNPFLNLTGKKEKST